MPIDPAIVRLLRAGPLRDRIPELLDLADRLCRRQALTQQQYELATAVVFSLLEELHSPEPPQPKSGPGLA